MFETDFSSLMIPSWTNYIENEDCRSSHLHPEELQDAAHAVCDVVTHWANISEGVFQFQNKDGFEPSLPEEWAAPVT